MAEIRFWQPGDLPTLRWFAAVNAWQILPPEDRAIASAGTVAALAEQNLMRVLQAPGGTAMIAIDGGRPVGYLLIAVQPDELSGRPGGYLADIYIAPEYRGAGLATRFHAAARDYLSRIGIDRSALWIHAHNESACRSAAKNGFEVRAVMLSRTLP